MPRYTSADYEVMAQARSEVADRQAEIFEEWADMNGLTPEQSAEVREELADTTELWEYMEVCLDPTQASVIEFLLHYAEVGNEAARKARLAARKVA